MISYALAAGLLFASLSAAGIVQAVAGLRAASRFARAARPAPMPPVPLTILKPLHGDEPLLQEALESFFLQDYPSYQIVFGVHSPTDPAIAIVRALRHRYPGRDVTLVIDSARHGRNHKISNLINMLPSARHDLLVLADSDVHAGPDYLRRLAAALAQPGAGVVTTLYAGRPASATLAAALGATGITHIFLPGALLARALGRQDCLGATMALHRATLQAIGGMPALADHLADDARLGTLVRSLGLSVALADTVPATTVPETTLAALIQHELRWARTIRSLAPIGHALSVVQFPIAWALLALLVSGGAAWSFPFVAASWATRAAAAHLIDRRLALAPAAPLWLLPLRDLLSVALVVASYHGGKVKWRGQVVPLDQPHYLLDAPPPVPDRAPEHALGKG
jgi:ceramide glucosyltransferase